MFTFKSSNLYDSLLTDYPRTEIWRLQTDKWQDNRGPKNFRATYYEGLNKGFNYIRDNYNKPLNPKVIFALYEASSQAENFFSDYQEGNFGGNITLLLAIPGNQNYSIAHISKAGIDEFINNLKTALTGAPDKKSNPHASYKWVLMTNTINIAQKEDEPLIKEERKYYKLGTIQPADFDDAEKLEEITDEIKKALEQTALYHEETTYKEAENYSAETNLLKQKKISPSCEIQSYIDSKNIEPILDEALSKYEEKMKSIASSSESPDNKRKKIIGEIVSLVRDVHQTHFFCDGNGRLFIFLLLRMQFLRFLKQINIVEYPCHFTGFSVEELIQESEKGFEKFNEYKVTTIKKQIESLKQDDFANTSTLQDKLNSSLSKDPFIALAQINELFLQLLENKINFSNEVKGIMGIFSKETFNFQKQMLSVLKGLYASKILSLLKNPDQPPCLNYEVFEPVQEKGRSYKKSTPHSAHETFYDLIQNHKILNDTTYPILSSGVLENDQKKSIYDLTKNEVNNYFSSLSSIVAAAPKLY